LAKAFSFSAINRAETISRLSSQEYDLLIIGGGITGAGIALDAASRGLSVALVEKHDFASGTSSKSTKLIHGGLRYLKQLEIRLVREVGQERAILHRNAPHIVIPENMLLPIVANGSLGKSSTSLGLYVYDMLAGVRRKERRVMLSVEKTLKREPLLRKEILLGGGLYKEYRTDDARLTIEVMKTARNLGAEVINYTQSKGFIYEKGKIAAIKAFDVLNNHSFVIHARKVVNAAGPWVDELRQVDNSLKGKRLQLTKGVHIVVPFERLPLQQAAYFDVADKRMMFAIPRGNATYIGTTDTNYRENIDTPTTTFDDVQYLLKAANYMFPTVNLAIEDVKSSWAGLRPLIHEDGKSPEELSRKDEIFYSPSGLISIAGGKLTGFRKMAERVVDVVAEMLEKEQNLRVNDCYTDQITLAGGDFESGDQVPAFAEKLFKQFQSLGVSMGEVRLLVDKFGSETAEILEKIPEFDPGFSMAIRIALAEVDYCVAHEMVTNLSDFFTRRTGRLYFDRGSIYSLLSPVSDRMAQLLNWSQEQKDSYLAAFMKEYKEAVTFV
jgi:glycerol-3-phosphate dehydrogenase